MKKLSDVRHEAYGGLTPFIPPTELAQDGVTFMLNGYRERENRQFKRGEVVFSITMLTHPAYPVSIGRDFLLTLTLTPIRERIGAMVKKYGALGPVALMKAAVEGSAFFYQFAEPDPSGNLIPFTEPDPSQVDPDEALEPEPHS